MSLIVIGALNFNFLQFIFNYSRGSEFVTVRTLPHRVRTVRTALRFFLTVPFFTASATVTVPFFSLSVRSVKRTEPLIVTVRFLVFDREPYRTKSGTIIRFFIGDREPYRTEMGTVNHLVLKAANRTAPNGGPLSVWI